MKPTKIQKEAAELMAKAVELLSQAQGQMRLAERFPVEPEPFTVLQFDKEFASPNAALESAGLSFDPAKLVPNLNGGVNDRLAQVIGRGAQVLVLDEEVFADVQRTTYRYVAIRIGDTWYTTAARANKTMSWSALVDFIGESPCAVAESWREIPVEPPQVIDQAGDDEDEDGATSQAEVDLATLLAANRKDVAAIVRKLTANGRKQTPAVLVDNIVRELKAKDSGK